MKKKKIWASKFFYRTSNLLFHLSFGQVEVFLICLPLQMVDFHWQVYDMARVVLGLFFVREVVLQYGGSCLGLSFH